MQELEVGRGRCEMLSSGHRMPVVPMKSQQPWLTAQDLYKAEPINLPSWMEKGLLAPPLPEEEFKVAGGRGAIFLCGVDSHPTHALQTTLINTVGPTDAQRHESERGKGIRG